MSTTTTLPIPVLQPGDRVRFTIPESEARYWWDVRTGDDRFTILTRQAYFRPKGELAYTIIDRERGVRGPCNLIGQSWDLYMNDMACAELLTALRNGTRGIDVENFEPVGHGAMRVEVSYRNNVPIEIEEARS